MFGISLLENRFRYVLRVAKAWHEGTEGLDVSHPPFFFFSFLGLLKVC